MNPDLDQLVSTDQSGDTLPKGYFLPYQTAWITDENRFKLWDKSRRIGATYAESYKAVRKRNLIDERRDYWFSSADESAAVEFSLYCQQWCKLFNAVVKEFTEELEDDKGYRFNNYVVEFPNGSRINCMSSNPRRFRSKGGDVCLDEFDWHDSPGEMLDAATPVTTWGYDISILTTRNGEGSEFDNLVKLARQIAAGEATAKELRTLPWSYHFTPITAAIGQGLVEKIRKLDHIDLQVRQEFLDECRAKSRNEDAFNQEYMCIPSATASTLIPYDLYQSCEMADCLRPLIPHTTERRQYFLGGDIGREKDLTVFWIWELVADILITRKVVKLHKTPYSAQLQAASDLLANQNILRGCIDATGIGDMLVESLQERFGSYRIEKIKFTAPIKEHLASLMLSGFADKLLRVPADRVIRDDFHSIRKTVTLAGNVRYDAARTEAGHADNFWAAALGKEAAITNLIPEVVLL